MVHLQNLLFRHAAVPGCTQGGQEQAINEGWLWKLRPGSSTPLQLFCRVAPSVITCVVDSNEPVFVSLDSHEEACLWSAVAVTAPWSPLDVWEIQCRGNTSLSQSTRVYFARMGRMCGETTVPCCTKVGTVESHKQGPCSIATTCRSARFRWFCHQEVEN